MRDEILLGPVQECACCAALPDVYTATNAVDGLNPVDWCRHLGRHRRQAYRGRPARDCALPLTSQSRNMPSDRPVALLGRVNPGAPEVRPERPIDLARLVP